LNDEVSDKKLKGQQNKCFKRNIWYCVKKNWVSKTGNPI